jgi:hypothetical protein
MPCRASTFRRAGSKILDHFGTHCYGCLCFCRANSFRRSIRDRRSHYDQPGSARADQSRCCGINTIGEYLVRSGKQQRRGVVIYHRRPGTLSGVVAAGSLQGIAHGKEIQHRPLRSFRSRCCVRQDDKGPMGVRLGNSISSLMFEAVAFRIWPRQPHGVFSKVLARRSQRR